MSYFSKPRLAAIGALWMLAGCALGGSLEQLRQKQPDASDFASALAAEYLSYASSENEQGRRESADYFASKGLASLAGKNPLPDRPQTSLPKAGGDEIFVSREALMALLTQDMKRVSPQKLARAQLLLDCWTQQAKTQAAEAASCADEFQSTMAELQTVADSFIFGDESAHTIIFLPRSSRLQSDDLAILADIAGEVGCASKYRIELTPQQEPTRATQALTQKRLQAIKAALVKKGVSLEHIRMKPTTGMAVHLSTDEEEGDADAIEVVARAHGACSNQGEKP